MLHAKSKIYRKLNDIKYEILAFLIRSKLVHNFMTQVLSVSVVLLP